ncbi:hypothetical protein [Paenibacillus kobensis]|uniref:hypothetical protein n=1 Tax=Paenibacillus kobensis TaxID=59841 RepID=UPI000FDB5481|nr:hypothetical protein [Paenibacillus kobensis]
MQADEVEAFGFFGGDLPVHIHTESRYSKRCGQPVGQMYGGMKARALQGAVDSKGGRMKEHPAAALEED